MSNYQHSQRKQVNEETDDCRDVSEKDSQQHTTKNRPNP